MEEVTNTSAPKPINIQKPKNVKTLNLKSDKNNDYEIQLYVYENNLIFEGQTQNAIPQKNYKRIYSFEEVQKNKYFLICENINEIYDEILGQISQNEKEVKISEKNEKANTLILTIPLNTKKIKECYFEIDEVVNNTNDKINELYSIVNNLTNEVKNLKEKNQKLEERVEEMEKLLLLPYKAKELQKQKDLNRIKEWISPGKDIKFKLLFKKSTDGNTTKDLHDHCDNKGKTLIIIETIEGRKFGGVTYDNWNTNSGWRKNPKDFVFSLDLNKKYNYSGSGDTTIGDITIGFVFGNNRTDAVDICFNNESLNEGISNGSPSFKTNKELNNGNEKFRTKEIEVYQIIMD
jgi:hypothetical protein